MLKGKRSCRGGEQRRRIERKRGWKRGSLIISSFSGKVPPKKPTNENLNVSGEGAPPSREGGGGKRRL